MIIKILNDRDFLGCIFLEISFSIENPFEKLTAQTFLSRIERFFINGHLKLDKV